MTKKLWRLKLAFGFFIHFDNIILIDLLYDHKLTKDYNLEETDSKSKNIYTFISNPLTEKAIAWQSSCVITIVQNSFLFTNIYKSRSTNKGTEDKEGLESANMRTQLSTWRDVTFTHYYPGKREGIVPLYCWTVVGCNTPN